MAEHYEFSLNCSDLARKSAEQPAKQSPFLLCVPHGPRWHGGEGGGVGGRGQVLRHLHRVRTRKHMSDVT